MEKQEEIKSVNEKVLAFGIATVMLLVVVICGALVIFLYSVSTELTSSLDEQIELKNEIVSKQNVIARLQRALDRAEGRLGVYEDFLIGTQVTAFKRLVKRFLKQQQTKSSEVTLQAFEQWAVNRMPYRNSYAMGGG